MVNCRFATLRHITPTPSWPEASKTSLMESSKFSTDEMPGTLSNSNPSVHLKSPLTLSSSVDCETRRKSGQLASLLRDLPRRSISNSRAYPGMPLPTDRPTDRSSCQRGKRLAKVRPLQPSGGNVLKSAEWGCDVKFSVKSQINFLNPNHNLCRNLVHQAYLGRPPP